MPSTRPHDRDLVNVLLARRRRRVGDRHQRIGFHDGDASVSSPISMHPPVYRHREGATQARGHTNISQGAGL